MGIKNLLACALLALTGCTFQTVVQGGDMVLVPNNYNPDVNLRITANRTTVPIGEQVSFSVMAGRAGYITLWDVGTSGRVQRLYPRESGRNMHIDANRNYGYGGPDSSYVFRASGPAGFEDVYAVWSRSPDIQPLHFSYASARGFSRDLSVVENRPRTDWATAKVTFKITGSGESSPPSTPLFKRSAIIAGGNVYLLAMGANVAGLSRTNADAAAFSTAMEQLFGTRIEARIYTNVTMDDFANGMRWLKGMAQPQDYVIVFYSGHGSFVRDNNGDEEDGFDEVFVPYDVELHGPSNQYVIRDDRFAGWINSLNTDNVLTVLDACHGGGLPKSVLQARAKRYQGGELGLGALPVLKGTEVNDATDRVKGLVFAAAREDELAVEMSRGGVFVQALLEELVNPRRHTLMEVFEGARESVQTTTGNRQHPVALGDTRIAASIQINN